MAMDSERRQFCSASLGQAMRPKAATAMTTQPLAFPGNPLDIIGDGIDGDCDGAESCYRDVDNDGYQVGGSLWMSLARRFNLDCAEFGEAYFYQPIDCDDSNPELTVPDEDGNCQVDPPSAAELCADHGSV